MLTTHRCGGTEIVDEYTRCRDTLVLRTALAALATRSTVAGVEIVTMVVALHRAPWFARVSS
jgi:hypothetical protein